MKTRYIVLALLVLSLVLTGQAMARKTLSRGQIALTIEKEGWSGREDTNRKMGNAGFGYPMGRWLKVYSGGIARDGVSPKANSAGEGFWVMSRTGGQTHISHAGNNKPSADIISIDFEQADWPEAYLGVVEDEHWALAIRKQNGNEATYAAGCPITNLGTNWWPGSGAVDARPTIKTDVALIWNFRYGRANSGESFTDRVANGEFGQLNPPAWAEALSEDDFPEQIGIQNAHSSVTGLKWTRKWFEYGHTDYDDFIINESVIENTSGATVEDIYVNFQNRFAQQQSLTWRGNKWFRYSDFSWDDHASSSAASNFLDGQTREAFLQGAGKPAGLQALKSMADDGHAMLYNHDGESNHITNLNLDVGDPYRYEYASQRLVTTQSWLVEGQMTHAQYFGIGAVDAIPPFNTYGGVDGESYVAPHDNLNTPGDESQTQPASITTWRYTDLNDYEQPVPFRNHDAFVSDDHVYDTLTQAGNFDEPSEAYGYTSHMTYGPWTLAPGEKAKVVVAYVGGMGGNAPKYENYKRYPEPFNFSWMGLWNGTNLGELDFKDNQPDIPAGEDALQRHFARAIDVYNWGYDIPNEPQSVKLTTKSNLQGQLVVSWSSFGEDTPDPDYTGAEAQDLRGYRVYRSSVQGQGPWQFLTEFSFEDGRSGQAANVVYDASNPWKTGPISGGFEAGIPLTANPYVAANDPSSGAEIPGSYAFTDGGTKAGFGYWYSVRMVDSGHSDWNGSGSVNALESSAGPSGGAQTGGRYSVVPVVPGDKIFDNLQAKVKIVPNVWKVDDDLHSYERQQNIRFTNLPGRCRIDMYTADGQRFWTFHHDNLDVGEATYIQFTENRPSNFGESLFPGIYFWKVTSLMPESTGKTQMGTFMIIK